MISPIGGKPWSSGADGAIKDQSSVKFLRSRDRSRHPPRSSRWRRDRAVKISEYPSGMPCWIDLATPDVGAARDFYTELFGWSARPSPERDGGYTVLHRGDDPVAGIG